MDIYEYPNLPITKTLDSVNLQNNHCQKCGRRNKSHITHMNNRRIKNEHRRCRHGDLLKCKRQQRLFPTELPPRSSVTQANDNHCHSMSNNILIDQFIQVQQLDVTRCNTQSHSYSHETDEYRMLTERNPKAQRVQQMIYLRENINNLTYRELHFPNEYIILKRLEEKNHLINQNHIKVDHCFHSLKLQYQTMSILHQNIPIKSFIYIKKDPHHAEFISKTPFKRCSLSENIEFDQNTLVHLSNDTSHLSYELNRATTTDKSLPTTTTVEMNDAMTLKQNDHLSTDDQTPETINRNSLSINPIDSPISITDYHDYKQPAQYSRNATQDFVYDTAVTVDVIKCPPYKQKINKTKPKLIHHPLIQANSNHVQSTSSMPIINQQESSPIYIPNQMIYFDQYADLHQQKTSADSIFYNPINQYFTRNCNIRYPPHFTELNELQSLKNHPNLDNISSIYETSERQNPSNSSHQELLSFTNSDTTSDISNTTNAEKNCTEAIDKIKQVLNTLKNNLLAKSIPKNESLNKKQISTTMTSDSLISNTSIQTTYSVSSTLPILNKKLSQLPLKNEQNILSTVNVENEILQIELDSLNNNRCHSNRTKSQTMLRNCAKNINSNQQTSEEDFSFLTSTLNYTRSRTKRPISHRVTVRYMSPSFMFVLQLLLLACLINRVLVYSFFGIVPTDTQWATFP